MQPKIQSKIRPLLGATRDKGDLASSSSSSLGLNKKIVTLAALQSKIQRSQKYNKNMACVRGDGGRGRHRLLLIVVVGSQYKNSNIGGAGVKNTAQPKNNQKYGVPRGRRGTRETLPTPHCRRWAAIKLEKEHCLWQPQAYFAGGKEGGGGRRPKMGADTLRANGGKTSGERGKRRRETEVDGGKQRRTAADSSGQRWTTAEEGSLLVMWRWCG